MNFTIAPNRIFKEDKGRLVAEVTFPFLEEGGSVVNMNHTFVDPSLRGQGVANQLVQEAVKVVRQNSWTVTPTCSYAVDWFSKHPEESDILAQ